MSRDVDLAIEHLRTKRTQLDTDGISVGVSRQALDEVLAELERLRGMALPDSILTHGVMTSEMPITSIVAATTLGHYGGGQTFIAGSYTPKSSRSVIGLSLKPIDTGWVMEFREKVPTS